VAEPADLDKPGPVNRPVLVVDFGAQYAQLIARRVREARVFSEVIPHTTTIEEIKARDPLAVVLSGGPASVYADGAPQLDPALFDLGLPVFGICYGFQAMAQALGGTVAHTGTSEYGRTELKVLGGELHSGLPDVHMATPSRPRRTGSTWWPAARVPRWPPSRTGADGWPGCNTTRK
jgi:GMP synthase (glutamine-hydrolysing)